MSPIATDVFNDCKACIFKVQQFKKIELLGLENEGAAIFRNVGGYLGVDTA